MEIKGFTYGYAGKRGDYRSEEGIRSQELLYQTGVNWVCLAFSILQKTANSTEINFDFGRSCSDRDIMAAVRRAHDHGVKVCLKPMINCADGVWRAKINFPDMGDGERDIYWDAWFENYGNFLRYYAELAEETGCEMFCVGCEMSGTERKEKHWRALLGEIRRVYSGKLIYNTNHGREGNVNWFDCVDYVGTSAYFPVGLSGADLESMTGEWKRVREEMRAIHEKWNKKVVFIEIGCRSARGCSVMPWDFIHRELPHDEDEQAAFYESCLSVFGQEEWFAGIFWWDWATFIYDSPEEAAKENGFDIHLKKAEQVLREWYGRL